MMRRRSSDGSSPNDHATWREALHYQPWKDFYDAVGELFSDLGSPGGAAKIAKDHPLVAALPP